MGIQDESEAPLEVAMMNTRISEAEVKKYVFVKNHVRELPTSNHKEPIQSPAHENTEEPPKTSKSTSKKLKKPHNLKNVEILQSDLEQLKSVYEKCKAVLKTIESKYGHLIDLGEGSSTSNYQEDRSSEEVCHCKGNKKIIFDEDGNEVLTEAELENHVCPKKLKLSNKHTKSRDNQNMQVEFEEEEMSLPNDLMSLGTILKDSDLSASYRNKVINKIKLLKMEHQNEIKFNRPFLIEKLKSDSENKEVFEFKGANLFSLPGYPDGKK